MGPGRCVYLCCAVAPQMARGLNLHSTEFATCAMKGLTNTAPVNQHENRALGSHVEGNSVKEHISHTRAGGGGVGVPTEVLPAGVGVPGVIILRVSGGYQSQKFGLFSFNPPLG